MLSWLVLRGRCRNCGAPISARYPAVELLTCGELRRGGGRAGFDDGLWLELPFVACLIALAGIDLDHKLLPNKIVYPMAAYGLVVSLVVATGRPREHLIAGVGAFAFLLLAVLAYPRGMGMGDVKLAGAMGLYLGLSVVPALLAAFASGTPGRARDHRARGRAGAQEGGAVRRLPGHRRPGRRARRAPS